MDQAGFAEKDRLKAAFATKDELKAVAVEILDSLRPKKLQIWQVKEALRFAIELADRERLE